MALRTTLLAIAALGLFASSLIAPAAGADTEVPSYDGQDCAEVYLFEERVGPVTLDGSDTCVSVIVHESDECDLEDVDPSEEVPPAEQCLEDLGEQASDTLAVDAKFPPTVCIYPFGCR